MAFAKRLFPTQSTVIC